MIEFPQKKVSEIQAMRELEKAGSLAEQMGYLNKVIESKSADNNEFTAELTMMVQELVMNQAQAITELTNMITGMGAMNV